MSDVIKLDPKGRRLTLERRKGHKCGHRRYYLDETPRKCVCQDCGTEIDAFDLLFRLARSEENLWYKLRKTTDEIKQKQQELDEISRSLRNAKARKRRQDQRNREAPPAPTNVVPISEKATK